MDRALSLLLNDRCPMPWRACKVVGTSRRAVELGRTAEGGIMAMLVWRVKLVAELESGSVSETAVACVERDDFAVPRNSRPDAG
jgi:hypothetical protein